MVLSVAILVGLTAFDLDAMLRAAGMLMNLCFSFTKLAMGILRLLEAVCAPCVFLNDKCAWGNFGLWTEGFPQFMACCLQILTMELFSVWRFKPSLSQSGRAWCVPGLENADWCTISTLWLASLHGLLGANVISPIENWCFQLVGLLVKDVNLRNG